MPTNFPLPNVTKKRLEQLLKSASEPERKRILELLSPATHPNENDGRSRQQRHFFPHEPSAKQQAFLDLDCREAFYGGAAGGGKSEALLMAALQYVHVPGYAALILRKDTQRLQLAGGLIPRSQQWLAGSDAVWNEAKLTWKFPTAGAAATLSFGYLQSSADKYRYGSSEYQYIAFDELTEFAEDDYRFLFSRLRGTTSMDVPLRMRAASNPGGAGHAWVKSRFIPDALANSLRSGEPPAARRLRTATDDAYFKNDVAFIPAKIADNPGLDATQYRASLSHLPSVLRQRLEQGDWSIHEAGLIREDWLRYYTRRGQVLDLLSANGERFASIDQRHCRRFATIDPAGTSEDRAREQRGRAASWTVLQVWEQPRAKGLSHLLLLRHVVRRRVGFDGLCALLSEMHRVWQCSKLYIENEKLGQAAVDLLKNQLPLRTIPTRGRDKVTRAAPLIAKLERGEIFLPKYDNAWRPELESEWLSWTGTNDETTDQIDAAAYAVIVADRQQPAGRIPIGPVVIP